MGHLPQSYMVDGRRYNDRNQPPCNLDSIIMIPTESRWECMDCGYIFYGVDTVYCDECGSYDIDEIEEVEGYETYDHS